MDALSFQDNPMTPETTGERVIIAERALFERAELERGERRARGRGRPRADRNAPPEQKAPQ
jgi:hypothetical protein